MSDLIWQIYAHIFLEFILIFVARISCGYTNPADVTAINNLYAALGSPLLPGWIPVGGDPCADAWQGVQCDNSNISSIIFNAANLGGELGDNLGSFASIKVIDLSNNNLSGQLPPSLESVSSLTTLRLQSNQLSGTLDVLQELPLNDLNVENNKFSGPIPEKLLSIPNFK